MFGIFNIIVMIVYAAMYFSFREGLRIAHKISLKAKFKGAKNYWWFDGVRYSKKLGIYYHINKTFTILYSLVALVVLTISWFEFSKIIIISLVGLLGAMLIPMNIYGFTHSTKKEFGTPFVLFERRRDGSKTYHSSMTDLFWSISPIFIALFEIFYLL